MLYLHSFFKNNKYKPLIVSFLIFSGILFFSILFNKGKPIYFSFLWAFLFASVSYSIFYSGKITLYRKIIFILISFIFILEFKFFLKSYYYAGPSCPVAISGTSITTLRDIIANPKSFALFIPVILWLLLVFFAGRLWCSWICWFGGIDECFSSLSKKSFINLNGFQNVLYELPSAILLFSALITLSSGVAVFCMWICPLKITPAFLAQSHLKIIQIPIFIAVGSLFLIILPLLSKKRTFCRYICPLRGLLRWFGSAHPLKININMQKCNKCNKCIEKCNSNSIDSNYRISPYCNFCLECFEACPQHAIETNPPIPQILFIALLLSGIVSSLVFF